MEITIYCMNCLLNKEVALLAGQPDEAKKADYFREALAFMAAESKTGTAPYLVSRMREICAKYFPVTESFEKIKVFYNNMMLELADSFRERMEKSKDPLRTALCFARIGNYIDFGANINVNPDELMQLFDQADPYSVDEQEYCNFCRDMETAKRFLLLADNCGEIVLDVLLLEQIKKRFPDAELSLMVRGGNVGNDATAEDAVQVQAQRVARVIPNGTRIAGTDPLRISEEAKEALAAADVILAKGQGNFETAYGCGKNIYYLFLCKCELFMRRFGKEKFGGMFINEKRVEDARRM